MIKFLWSIGDDMPIELSLPKAEVNRTIKASKDPEGVVNQSLIFGLNLKKDSINNPLYEVFQFNKNYLNFRLNIQILEKENIIEEYEFYPTPQVEYTERFDGLSLDYYNTRLSIRNLEGGKKNANKD